MSKRTCSLPDCDRPHLARGYCSTHYNQTFQADRHKVKVQVECANCGKPVAKSASNNKARRPVCSYHCRTALVHGESRSHKQLIGPIDALPVVRPTTAPVNTLRAVKRVFTSGPCPHCGDQFTAATFNLAKLARYCSPGCAKGGRRRDHGQFWVSGKRRERLYARDGWTCQLCMEPVRKDLHHGDDWAPSLDHIVPRSRGGADSDDNLRLAHRWCNAIRGDDSFYAASDLAPTPAA